MTFRVLMLILFACPAIAGAQVFPVRVHQHVQSIVAAAPSPAPSVVVLAKTCDVVVSARPPQGHAVKGTLGAQFWLNGAKVGSRVTKVTNGAYQFVRANLARGDHQVYVVWSWTGVTLPASHLTDFTCERPDLRTTHYATQLATLVAKLPAEAAGQLRAIVAGIQAQAEALDVLMQRRDLAEPVRPDVMPLMEALTVFTGLWSAYTKTPVSSGISNAAPVTPAIGAITDVLWDLHGQVLMIRRDLRKAR